MEEKVMKIMGPVAEVVGSNRYLNAIRDAFMLAFPLTMFGSILLIILNIPGFADVAPGLHQFLSQGFSHSIDATMNMMTIFVAFGIGYYISKSRGVEPIFGAAIAAASFFILTPFFETGQDWPANMGVHLYRFGAQGMFVALIFGIVSSEIYCFITNKNLTIKMPEQVPPTVAKSFAAIIPGTVALLSMTIIAWIFMYTPWTNVHDFIYQVVQAPLENLGSTLPATLIAIFFVQFLWFFGLHGQIIVNSVLDPIWNSLALQNVNGAEHIVTKPFMETFTVGLGGSGGTLVVLIIILIFVRSKRYRQFAKMAIAPGIFNVNEPVTFGLPVVLNVKVAIPWIIAPMASVAVAYLAMASGIVPVTTGVTVPWTIPVVISGFLATSSVMGSLLQLVQMLVIGVIWFPFIMFLDREEQQLFQASEEKQAE
ncbi:PTS transporter subunit EIIC [Mollicutes bacterium LVI A0039]|nr:PTS transporter subunit EIIC [Mollicutes bacterium LVI A0039]